MGRFKRLFIVIGDGVSIVGGMTELSLILHMGVATLQRHFEDGTPFETEKGVLYIDELFE